METVRKQDESSTTGDSSTSSSGIPSSTIISEGSLFAQEPVQDTKTITAVKARDSYFQQPTTTPSFAVTNVPNTGPMIFEPQPMKSAGMYVKRLPERLQRLQDENNCPQLSVQTFFEFMRTAYQVNDSIEELATTLSARSEIDWIKLAKTDLNSQMTPEKEGDAITDLGKDKTLLSQREDKSTGTEQIKVKDPERPVRDAPKEFVAKDAPSIEEGANKDDQQSPSSTVTHTRTRRTSLRRNNPFQKPCIPSTQPPHPDENLIISNEDKKESPQVPKETEKIGDVPQEQQNHSPSTFIPAKKIRVPTVETFTEHKEQLLAKIMKRKLSDILHEGLLDSVLPYMLPKPLFSQPVIKKSITNTDVKKVASSCGALEGRTIATPGVSKEKEKERNKHRRKSLENEVEIHVCDEAKNIKKDFRCPQKLLVQKMCYFADVTAGQKLEEIDISVHCDIVIFDWLMRWVKKDIIKRSEWPVFEASNVIPIMVSASFLQMEPLLEDCLSYCHDNMSEVLKTSAILTCLNDNLLTRLAALFTNVDVESLKDKKDKVQSRLFCKLIVSLVDTTPDNKRGHYSSLATLFKCGKCGKNVVRSVSDYIPCIPSAMRLDTKGDLHSMHTRDLTWTLNDYIATLRAELRSWRKVYWRLWGDSHFLFCKQCGTYFPVHQMDWCCHHPEIPQFFANEQQRSSPFPLGRYPCCSQRAYRFETLPNREGCRFKEHLPALTTDRDMDIMNIFATHRDIIALEPPQLFFPEKITRLVARDPALQPGKLACKESMWWDGLELVPLRPKLGLLAKIWGGSGLRQPCQLPDPQKSSRKIRRQASQATDISSPGSSVGCSDEDDGETGCGDSSAGDESDNSEESHAWPPLKQVSRFKRKTRYYAAKRSDGGRSWSTNLTVRYNQDNQRDFEERASLQMSALLTKRTSAECGLLPRQHTHSRQHGHTWNHVQPLGGTYVKLEAEFREQLAQTHKCKNSTQSKGSARMKSSKMS